MTTGRVTRRGKCTQLQQLLVSKLAATSFAANSLLHIRLGAPAARAKKALYQPIPAACPLSRLTDRSSIQDLNHLKINLLLLDFGRQRTNSSTRLQSRQLHKDIQNHRCWKVPIPPVDRVSCTRDTVAVRRLERYRLRCRSNSLISRVWP